MRHDGTCWHCLLVRCEGVSESILVESEGYDYARYCAFVPDHRKLDLSDVPVERYGDRPIQKHRPDPQPER